MSADERVGDVDGRWHVVPVSDSAAHRESLDCWCSPTPEADEPRVIVHHSADGREIAE